jgi:translation factor GUF1, mitochondrial
MYPEPTQADSLHSGQVGYVYLGMKSTREAHIGDTFFSASQSLSTMDPLPGFKPAKSVVFSGTYPMDSTEYPRLQEALDRLTLNDSSVTVVKETSHALGQGFRLGFLGTLHMDVFTQRLMEEHDATVINTAPSVLYKVEYFGEKDHVWIRNPAQFPEADELAKVKAFYEPVVLGTLIFPSRYLGSMIELCGNHRGEQVEFTYIDDAR